MIVVWKIIAVVQRGKKVRPQEASRYKNKDSLSKKRRGKNKLIGRK